MQSDFPFIKERMFQFRGIRVDAFKADAYIIRELYCNIVPVMCIFLCEKARTSRKEREKNDRIWSLEGSIKR